MPTLKQLDRTAASPSCSNLWEAFKMACEHSSVRHVSLCQETCEHSSSSLRPPLGRALGSGLALAPLALAPLALAILALALALVLALALALALALLALARALEV